jgi:hypothetical protein
VILRLRAAFSALTGDRVRGVIIADCRTGRCSGSSRQGRFCQPGWGKGAQHRYGGGDRGSPGPAPVGSPPGSGQAPGDGEQPQRSVLSSVTCIGPDNDSVWVQVGRSQARRTMAGQTAVTSIRGRLPRLARKAGNGARRNSDGHIVVSGKVVQPGWACWQVGSQPCSNVWV